MGAPTPTARVTPAGLKLEDGQFSTHTFAADPDVGLWEKSVKPPGMDGGDKIDLTNHHNVAYRTSAPRNLKTLTASTFKAFYDPDVYNQLMALINVKTTCTTTFIDGSTLAYFGYLKSVEFDDMVEGTAPECTVTIETTNVDPSDGSEAGPVLTSVSGT